MTIQEEMEKDLLVASAYHKSLQFMKEGVQGRMKKIFIVILLLLIIGCKIGSTDINIERAGKIDTIKNVGYISITNYGHDRGWDVLISKETKCGTVRLLNSASTLDDAIQKTIDQTKCLE